MLMCSNFQGLKKKKEYPKQAVSSTAACTVNTFELRQIMFYGTATVNEFNCHIGQPPGNTRAIKAIQLMVPFSSWWVVQCKVQTYRDILLNFLNTTIRVPIKIYVDISIMQTVPELFPPEQTN